MEQSMNLPNPVPRPAEAFALLIETACREFETLQSLLTGELQLVATRHGMEGSAGVIRMALAKSFLFNTNRANRVCFKNKGLLAIDRDERERFLSATKTLADVRDVNEHGYDGDQRSEKNRPSMHEQEGGFRDETSLVVADPTNVLMGPLNLYDIYNAVARMRAIAGWLALAKQDGASV
jgi:hypothetical protein